MKIEEYFEKSKGVGILSTADSSGRVNSAVYARPHVTDENQVAFVMTDRKTFSNVRKNPHVSYLFKEEGSGYSGLRFSLTKIREEKSPNNVRNMVRRRYPAGKRNRDKLHVVYFNVDEVLPLLSSGTCPVKT